jgi:hypothetical protein
VAINSQSGPVLSGQAGDGKRRPLQFLIVDDDATQCA